MGTIHVAQSKLGPDGETYAWCNNEPITPVLYGDEDTSVKDASLPGVFCEECKRLAREFQRQGLLTCRKTSGRRKVTGKVRSKMMVLITGTRTQNYVNDKCIGETIRGIFQLTEVELSGIEGRNNASQGGVKPVCMHPFIELRGGYTRTRQHYGFDKENKQLLVEIEDIKVYLKLAEGYEPDIVSG